MLPQPGGVLVRLTARIAHKRTFTGVNTHVIFQRQLACETRAAVQAPTNQVSKSHTYTHTNTRQLKNCFPPKHALSFLFRFLSKCWLTAVDLYNVSKMAVLQKAH